MQAMKVLLTGGTGFVGSAVLERLCADGHEVVLLARHPDSASSLQANQRHANVSVVAGDILKPDTLVAAINGCDAVVHLVGIIAEAGPATFERIHHEGTRNVVEATRNSGVQRFVHMSALGTRPDAVARYHRSKWEAEECVRSSGLAWTLFRPSIIYGPGDGFVNLFVKMARWLPVMPVMGDGENQFQPVPVTDVAKCFSASLCLEESIGECFDLCGPQRLSFVEVLRTILRVTGRNRSLVHIPLPLARVQASAFEFVYRTVLRKPPPLSHDQLIMLQEDNVGNPEWANTLFNLQPEPFATGIARYLN